MSYRVLFVLPFLLFTAGCAGVIDNAPINVALAEQPTVAQEKDAPPRIDGDTAVALTFSGGGTRAAAFAHGAMKALAAVPLRDEPGKTLLDRVAFLSGVSGGSVAAAYYAYRGPAAVSDFRERFLLQNVEASLRTRVTPANLARAFEGGVNDRTGLPRWLDQHLFGGATFADVAGRGHAMLWVNASDIYNRNVFIFDERTFSVLCSDLRRYPLSEAVAASAAVPIAFAPVLIRNYANRCSWQEPAWVADVLGARGGSAVLRAYAEALRRYRDVKLLPNVSLLDGGITDNLGVYGLTVARETASAPYQPMEPASAVRLRNMLFVVVDAGRGPEGDWPQRPSGPTGTEIAMAVADTLIDANTRNTFDAFNAAMETWRQDLIGYRCRLSSAEVQRLRGTLRGWNCRDLNFHVVRIGFDGAEPALRSRLNEIKTAFVLPEAEVDLVIEAAGRLLASDPAYRRFLSRLD